MNNIIELISEELNIKLRGTHFYLERFGGDEDFLSFSVFSYKNGVRKQIGYIEMDEAQEHLNFIVPTYYFKESSFGFSVELANPNCFEEFCQKLIVFKIKYE